MQQLQYAVTGDDRRWWRRPSMTSKHAPSRRVFTPLVAAVMAASWWPSWPCLLVTASAAALRWLRGRSTAITTRSEVPRRQRRGSAYHQLHSVSTVCWRDDTVWTTPGGSWDPALTVSTYCTSTNWPEPQTLMVSYAPFTNFLCLPSHLYFFWPGIILFSYFKMANQSFSRRKSGRWPTNSERIYKSAVTVFSVHVCVNRICNLFQWRYHIQLLLIFS